jgi:hypothetical protein
MNENCTLALLQPENKEQAGHLLSWYPQDTVPPASNMRHSSCVRRRTSEREPEKYDSGTDRLMQAAKRETNKERRAVFEKFAGVRHLWK